MRTSVHMHTKTHTYKYPWAYTDARTHKQANLCMDT